MAAAAVKGSGNVSAAAGAASSVMNKCNSVGVNHGIVLLYNPEKFVIKKYTLSIPRKDLQFLASIAKDLASLPEKKKAEVKSEIWAIIAKALGTEVAN